MKKFFVLVLLGLVMVGCDTRGKSKLLIRGDEPHLPTELKGLRVWEVDVGHRENHHVYILPAAKCCHCENVDTLCH